MKILSQQSPVNTNDRAFNYGDGVFSTMLVKQGKVELMSMHIARLVNDAARLGIAIEPKQLCDAIVSDATALTQDRAVLKVHVSAGEGGRGYARNDNASPIVRFSVNPYPAHYDQLKESGLTLICAKTPLALQPALAGLKHLNRLEQVLVKNEINAAQSAMRQDVDDALVCDTQGDLVETSVGNLFWKKAHKWFTPALDKSGVNGVMRQLLIRYFTAKGIAFEEVKSPIDTLVDASAVLVTNALMGVMPVKVVVDQGWAFDDSVSTAKSFNRVLDEFIIEQKNDEVVNEVG
ncbi:aminodeoxychorismate lyase [Alteromonas sp. KUL49]|uniref:aminodeoxychorismate lyase n=1 Tax=Alteromonas sp. KUL49 TaxID=2480798 RepID=UPI00102EF57A|nr:aminodeoxychorismate lyase [Alteromonas sp. KUL49]TAP35854.1 aminodeoxychorismate lyase [Alteromonas sp. KUL49]GEA13233.1 aminodeoxychorismate lyase [Alteromonas sp. KUL49]